MFPCSCCPNAYCEDHLPAEARFLDPCERIESLGFNFKNGVYVHCSKQCEEVAITEFGYKVPGGKALPPCPPALDLSSKFGCEVDESLQAPEDFIVTGKRSRSIVNYAENQVKSRPVSNNSVTLAESDEHKDKRWKENEEPWIPNAMGGDSEGNDDDEIECLGVAYAKSSTPVTNKGPSSKSVLNYGSTNHTVKRAPLAKLSSARAPILSSQEVGPLDYGIWLPITSEGFLILIMPNKDGSAVFAGYRKDSKGQPGPAEQQRLFRGNDVFVAVNGKSCVGKSMETAIAMLRESQTEGKSHVYVRMRPA